MKANIVTPDPSLSATPLPTAPPHTNRLRGRLTGLAIYSLVLAGCFFRPLYELARFAWHSDLYSHILLIPFVSAYLIRLRKPTLVLASGGARLAVIPLLFSLGSLLSYWHANGAGFKLGLDDYLALMTFAFLGFLVTGSFLFVGPQVLRQIIFPVALLLFMIPFPSLVLRGIESFLQYYSADVADMLFNLIGTPVLREETFFQLPGIQLEVAPECSGVHSTLVLFITSLVAGYLFLRPAWKRGVLTMSVIPLALLRNGFRIFTIGQLCIYVNPDMIHSPVHTHGGPLFFALSLIPFFLVLMILRKGEAIQPK